MSLTKDTPMIIKTQILNPMLDTKITHFIITTPKFKANSQPYTTDVINSHMHDIKLYQHKKATNMTYHVKFKIE